MISVSPFELEAVIPDAADVADECREVKYLLRRADHETVAAIRATDPRASDRHAVMAWHYGEQSRGLMAKLDARNRWVATAPER